MGAPYIVFGCAVIGWLLLWSQRRFFVGRVLMRILMVPAAIILPLTLFWPEIQLVVAGALLTVPSSLCAAIAALRWPEAADTVDAAWPQQQGGLIGIAIWLCFVGSLLVIALSRDGRHHPNSVMCLMFLTALHVDTRHYLAAIIQQAKVSRDSVE